jgi:hypothetical protein
LREIVYPGDSEMRARNGSQNKETEETDEANGAHEERPQKALEKHDDARLKDPTRSGG